MTRMHAGERDIDAALVRRLLEGQLPEWAPLPIRRVPSSGTDNALYRLGDELVVRLPRIDWAVAGVQRELDWLPRLAPHLPVAVPVPLARGEPTAAYPWPWSVYRWLEGEHPPVGGGADPAALAVELARFAGALQRIDAAGAPPAARGKPLAPRDEQTRTAIAALAGAIDAKAATAVWEEAVRAPAWSQPPVWLHGDLMPTNLLLRGGRLAAVIDFGTAGVGDPACDLLAAWTLLPSEARGVFRTELGVDDATWARGRGWALTTGLNALPYYKDTNPVLAANAAHRIREVLSE